MKESEKSIDEVLVYGTKNEIINLKCECGGKIHFKYSKETDSMRYWCSKCFSLSTLYKIDTPNCFVYFGETL